MLLISSFALLGFLIFAQDGIQGNAQDYLEERTGESGPAWDYLGEDGALGPNDWSKSYEDCSGKKQSPILIDQSSDGHLERFRFINYDVERRGMILVNNGHTVELELPEDEENLPCIEGAGLGARYCFRQLHFHWGMDNSNGSEHKIQGGRGNVMEMHLVHTNPDENKNGNAGIAVLGVLFKTNCIQIGYSSYHTIFDALSNVTYKGQRKVLDEGITLSALLPRRGFFTGRPFYRYNGSLTTPPCTEGVIWSVFERPLCIYNSQMELFRGLYRTAEGEQEKPMAPNFRPLQDLNERSIHKGKDSWWM